MTSIWIVNDEYVSVAGLIGIHLGYISKGFDINKFKAEFLTSNEIHKKAEKYFELTKKYPDTKNLKMVVDSFPPNIEEIINNIYISLKNNSYDQSKNNELIEWLTNNYEEYEFYDGTYEIDSVISKSCFEQHYLIESSLIDFYDLNKEEEITDALKIEYVKEKLNAENGYSECAIIFSSITFATTKSTIVLGFDLYSFNNPGALPILTWGKFYLSDTDIWFDIQNDSSLIKDYLNISDTEILKLKWTKDF